MVKTISVFEFFRFFPSEAAAVRFVEGQIWEDGPVCPHCRSGNTVPRLKRHGHRCRDCRADFTVRHGTIFEKSRLSLVKWLYAIYLVQTSRKSVSSLQLSKELAITQKTAWFLLHRIREACQQGDWKLTFQVEMDATCFGGKRKNMNRARRKVREPSGRGAVGKQPVIGMRGRDGRLKAVAVHRENKKTVRHLAKGHIEKGATVFTDEARAYDAIPGAGFQHQTVNHSAGEYINGMAHTNGIESVWALLKRGYTGTFHHFSMKHCQRYVDEFVFRLNEGHCAVDTLDRMKSVCMAGKGKRLTYKTLMA